MGKEKNPLVKENWSSNFTLIGTPKISDFTFKLDQHSEKSDWIYNTMNLGIDCGEKHGVVYAEMMGGYASEREGVIYAHGKDENGNDDFSTKIEVAWEDRNDTEIMDMIGRMCFIKVGLSKDTKGNTFFKNFLSAYDAIEYIKDNFEEDMVVKVNGTLKYSTYQDRTQIRKTINSIYLTKVNGPEDYNATFTQTMLLDRDSASLKDIDNDKGVMYVHARVLDYISQYNGIDVKGNFPFDVCFEYAMDFTKQEQCKKIVDKLFKIKKGIRQVTFEGEFVEGGAIVQATMDDVPDDIKELIDIGIFTEEEALEKCTANGSKERRMVLKRPHIKLVGENKVPTLQMFDEKFQEEDLVLDCMGKNEGDEMPFDEDESSSTPNDDDMGWLADLD